MMPRSIARVALPPCKPTYDELYLQALKIRCDYAVGAKQAGGLKIDGGPIVKEIESAIEHYRELAWKEVNG